jgi:hypothetical protein
MSAAEIPEFELLPPPKIESKSNVEFGSMLHGRTTPRYVEKQKDEDFRAIESAKNKYPRYSSKVIFSHILEEKVPLYKFKQSYSVHDLFTWFTIKELKDLKTKYEKQGIQEEDATFMDELITRKEEYLIHQAEQRERVKTLQDNFKKESSCVTQGGRIKNILRKKNKSNKNKSKRINKRIKKNKRYSRKTLKK